MLSVWVAALWAEGFSVFGQAVGRALGFGGFRV